MLTFTYDIHSHYFGHVKNIHKQTTKWETQQWLCHSKLISVIVWIYSQQTASCQERTENELCLLTKSTDYKWILKQRLSRWMS